MTDTTPRRRFTVRMEDLKTKPSPLAVLREQNKQLLAERNQHAENARWYKSQLDAKNDGLERAEDTYCELMDKKRECKSLYEELAIAEHTADMRRREFLNQTFRMQRIQRDLKDANTSLKVYRVSIALTGVAVCAAAVLHVIGV